jgi:hypothetical protein
MFDAGVQDPGELEDSLPIDFKTRCDRFAAPARMYARFKIAMEQLL